LNSKLRKTMGAAAIKVAKSCQYYGAGTVEFLVDDQENFYFLEMNTRLQVEHPVTELITGLDLVEQQIRIAQGEILTLKQEDVTIHGHAIELRIYAENPLEDFTPSIGTLSRYSPPKMQNIRVDSGYRQGMEIPIYYDPMLAKLISYGRSRSEAIQQLLKAVRAFEIEGVATTLSFGAFVLNHPDFLSGKFDTHFVANHYTSEKINELKESQNKTLAKLALYLHLRARDRLRLPSKNGTNWKRNRLEF